MDLDLGDPWLRVAAAVDRKEPGGPDRRQRKAGQ